LRGLFDRPLEEACFGDLVIERHGMRPLGSASPLRTLAFGNQYPTEEFAFLAVRSPQAKCDHFAPYIKFPSPLGDEDVMVVGNGEPFLSSTRDSARLRRYEEELRALQ
jgi:hypothetical protein